MGLPKELPEIKNLEISGREVNSQILVPMNFRSFKGLPEIIPQLESIDIFDSSIQNFESLTAKMPSLKDLWIYDCHIHNFKGFPQNPKKIVLHNCKIDSFEVIPIHVKIKKL